MVEFPHHIRDGEVAYGSLTLADNQRVASGSEFTSAPVDISRDEIKSFGFRGAVQGSWYIDVAFRDEDWVKYADGTFPGGGTVKTASFTEAFNRARVRARFSQLGSLDAFYGGQITFTP